MKKIREFFAQHQKRILTELRQAGIDLTFENIPKILEQTSFSTRSQQHPETCPCYENNKPCHTKPDLENFSCFLCGCDKYKSESPTGGCKILMRTTYIDYPDSPEGKLLDCSNCYVPHSKVWVKKYLKENLPELREISKQLAKQTS